MPIEKWNEYDLVRRLCHALDLALRALERLAQAGYSDPTRPAANIRPEKVIAETGVLLYGASLARQHREVNVRIHRLARRLASHARSAQIRLGLALNPALAFDYSLAHVLLTRLGFPDADFDRLLDQCRAAQASAGRERVPHRALEQEWIEGLRHSDVETSHLAGKARRLLRQTILAHPMDLFSATDEDLYAFTHAVMYATGFRRASGALPRSRSAILAEAEGALARCLDSQDYDLTAEILLAWPLTGKSWSPVAAFAFRVLAEVEDKAGFLPTPATRLSELKAREGEDRSRYLFATAYHTAYVMGLLCAAALQPGCAPPIAWRGGSSPRGAVRHLLSVLHDGKPAPHWRDAFEKLSGEQQDALGGFLFHIALERKASERDFAGLAHVLRTGLELGLAATPVASQAAELLERIGSYAGSHAAPAAHAPALIEYVSMRELPFGFSIVHLPPGTTAAAS